LTIQLLFLLLLLFPADVVEVPDCLPTLSGVYTPRRIPPLARS